jgi:hypothetical protein
MTEERMGAMLPYQTDYRATVAMLVTEWNAARLIKSQEVALAQTAKAPTDITLQGQASSWSRGRCMIQQR